METTTTIETRLALVQRVSSDRVEVRFREGITFTTAGIQEILAAREQLGRDAPPARVLIVLPELADFDMDMITRDHYKGQPVRDHSRAVAWVVHNDSNERFTQMYFAYFPSPVPSAIFRLETEAMAWLGMM